MWTTSQKGTSQKPPTALVTDTTIIRNPPTALVTDTTIIYPVINTTQVKSEISLIFWFTHLCHVNQGSQDPVAWQPLWLTGLIVINQSKLTMHTSDYLSIYTDCTAINQAINQGNKSSRLEIKCMIGLLTRIRSRGWNLTRAASATTSLCGMYWNCIYLLSGFGKWLSSTLSSFFFFKLYMWKVQFDDNIACCLLDVLTRR